MNRRGFMEKVISAGAAGIVLTACSNLSNAQTVDGKDESKASKTDQSLKKGASKKMKIVVLTGSPRKNVNTNIMATRFIEGATEAGHEVFRFDCAHQDIAPCIGCNHCNMNGPCIYDDAFTPLRAKLIEADLVAFVSPMYYFGFSAQLKRVIDRFYAINGTIKGASKKSVFLMAYADNSKAEAEAMTMHYKTLIRYLGWKDAGMVIAPGVWTAGSVKNTKYVEEAYQLGKKI